MARIESLETLSGSHDLLDIQDDLWLIDKYQVIHAMVYEEHYHLYTTRMVWSSRPTEPEGSWLDSKGMAESLGQDTDTPLKGFSLRPQMEVIEG